MRRREFLAAGITMAGALATRPAFGQPSPNRAAVVIGVDSVGSLPKLRAARSGARAMADWLQGEGFEVKLIVDDPGPVAPSSISAAIKSFVDRGTLDQLVVYFAGHGFISGGLSEFWMLSDAPDDPNAAVSLTESRELARQVGIPNVVFISDACRSRADSLHTERMHGTVVFPNRTAPPNLSCDVDRFLATRIGDPAWERPVTESASEFEGIYTTCFLDAFKRPYKEMVQEVRGARVVPNRRLQLYLANEVPKRAQRGSVAVRQHPDAEVCSGDLTYIGRVSTPERAEPGAIPLTVSDVASTAVGESIGGGRPQDSETSVEGLAASSGFAAAQSTIAQARGARDLSARTGFVISGQHIEALAARPGIPIVHGNSPAGERPSAKIEIDLGGAPAASVALRFSDGSGTVLAALDKYIANVVVDDGRVTSVSYVPSHQSDLWSMYEHEADRVEELHSAVAAAARFGVFRIEGPRETRNQTADRLAGRIRMAKSIDPTLGLYAAYAYAQADLGGQVRSVRAYMRGDLGVDLFDVAMLAGELRGRAPGAPDDPFPFFPMLAQGWGLLRVREVRLPESVAAARDHLRASLWTTLDRGGMEIVEGSLRSGHVR